MKFLRRTAGCTKLVKKRNTEILQELNINSVLEHLDQYRNNWKQHAQRMDRSRIPPQIMTYGPKGIRSLGKPLKLWRVTVTGHRYYVLERRRLSSHTVYCPFQRLVLPPTSDAE
jgi:hypothetical protein